jgi:restriction system protein
MDALARLPWWVCAALAVFTHVALHALSLRPQAIVVDPGDVGAALGGFLVGGVLESLQYLVPALCMSALLARLTRLPAAAAGPEDSGNFPADAGNGMTAWEFESMTAGGLRIVRRSRGKRFAAPA